MSEYQNFDDYNDNNDDNEYNALSGKKITVGKIIKKTLLYSLRISAFLVIAILLWRIFSGEPPKNMKELISFFYISSFSYHSIGNLLKKEFFSSKTDDDCENKDKNDD